MMKTVIKTPFATACIICGILLGPLVAGIAQDLSRSHAAVIVKDSVATMMIRTRLAAGHAPSLERIKVDTDTDGVVWLSANAGSQAAAAKAVSIALATGHGRAVRSDIKIRQDDSIDTTRPPAPQRRPSQGNRGVEQAVGLSLALALLSGTSPTRH